MGINAEMRKVESMIEEMVKAIEGNLRVMNKSICDLNERLEIAEGKLIDINNLVFSSHTARESNG